MKLETEPISDDEWLLRRVHIQMFRTDVTPLSPNAFRPVTKGTHVDNAGISLFREACQQNSEDILRLMSPERQADNGIVRLRVSDLKKIKLSVVADPISDIPGHVVIPELNAQVYENDKKSLLPVMAQLAEIGNDNILRWPPNQRNCHI